MIRRPPRSTQSRSSAASDVYKRQKNGSAWTSTASSWTRAKTTSRVKSCNDRAHGEFQVQSRRKRRGARRSRGAVEDDCGYRGDPRLQGGDGFHALAALV